MDPLVAGSYARTLPTYLAPLESARPWDAAAETEELLLEAMSGLPGEFTRDGDVAVHHRALIHPSAVISGAVVVEDGAVVGPHVRLRDGVYVGARAKLGSSVEVKSSWVFEDSALAHLNYVGNSIVGHDVNIEAGAVIANHFNERDGELISILLNGTVTPTGRSKFGAAIGPGTRIGANAVTTPGTLLASGSIVGRLELVDQVGAREGAD